MGAVLGVRERYCSRTIRGEDRGVTIDFDALRLLRARGHTRSLLAITFVSIVACTLVVLPATLICARRPKRQETGRWRLGSGQGALSWAA